MNTAIFLSILIWSGAPIPGPAQGNDLDGLIRALQSKYNKISTLSADFTQIHLGRTGKSRRESGRLLLKKPGKMRWDYSSPQRKLFISDGKWIHEYVPSDGYATRTRVREADDLRAPFMFLLGRGNLRRDFKVIEFSAESPVRAGNRVLHMVPKKARDFRELHIEIEPTSLQLARLSFVDDDGSRSDFVFANIRENIPAAGAQFIFQPPAGVEIRSNSN